MSSGEDSSDDSDSIWDQREPLKKRKYVAAKEGEDMPPSGTTLASTAKKPEATTRTSKAKLSQEKFPTAIIDLNEVQARQEEKLQKERMAFQENQEARRQAFQEELERKSREEEERLQKERLKFEQNQEMERHEFQLKLERDRREYEEKKEEERQRREDQWHEKHLKFQAELLKSLK